MAVKDVRFRAYRCDYRGCSVADRFEEDVDAGKAGWAVLAMRGRKYALCDEHKIAIETQLSQIAVYE